MDGIEVGLFVIRRALPIFGETEVDAPAWCCFRSFTPLSLRSTLFFLKMTREYRRDLRVVYDPLSGFAAVSTSTT